MSKFAGDPYYLGTINRCYSIILDSYSRAGRQWVHDDKSPAKSAHITSKDVEGG